jgi:hypothetical protein
MATVKGGGGTKGRGTAKVKKVSPARNIVGAVLLVTFSGIAILEFYAKNGFNQAVAALERRLPKDSDARVIELPSRVEAEKILGRKADGPLVNEGAEQRATYTWRGPVRKHMVTAYYTTDKAPSLVRISTD